MAADLWSPSVRRALTARVLREVIPNDITSVRIVWAPEAFEWAPEAFDVWAVPESDVVRRVIDVSHIAWPTFEYLVGAVLGAPCWPSTLDC